MADVIDHRIIGDDMQLVEIELDPGEGVRAEAGAMMYMEQGIEMQTSTGGGIFKGFKRMITGESFFITTFLFNGNGKGRPEDRCVFRRLELQAKLPATVARQSDAEYAPGMEQHEIDHLRRDTLRGADEVPLVFTMLVVDQHDETAGLQLRHRLGN